MPFFYCTCALGTKGNGTYCISKLKCALFEVTFSWLRNIDALSLNNALLQLCRDVKKYLLVNTSLKIDPIHFLGPGMKVFAVLPWLKLTNSTCFFSNSPLVLSYYRTGSGLHDWLKAFNKQMAWGIPNVQLVTIPKPCAGNRTRGIFFVLFCFIWENYAIFHWMSSPVSAALLRMLTFSCCLFLGARGLSSRGVSRGAISKIELRWRWQGRGGGGRKVGVWHENCVDPPTPQHVYNVVVFYLEYTTLPRKLLTHHCNSFRYSTSTEMTQNSYARTLWAFITGIQIVSCTHLLEWSKPFRKSLLKLTSYLK